jgi:hypothetical protein
MRAGFTQTPREVDVTPDPSDDPVTGATAAQISARRYGGAVRASSFAFTLTTSLQTVLAGNPRRVFWAIYNRGVVNAAIDIDSSMTFANGIPMAAAGGFVQSSVDEDGETVAWPVFGVCESGTSVVRVVEVMRV